VCWGPIARDRLTLSGPDHVCSSVEEVLIALGALACRRRPAC
jgi:hypothetical protein